MELLWELGTMEQVLLSSFCGENLTTTTTTTPARVSQGVFAPPTGLGQGAYLGASAGKLGGWSCSGSCSSLV